MLENLDLKNVLVLDIETVPQYPAYEEMNDLWKKLWDLKVKNIVNETTSSAVLYERAGFYAEFAKIVCISVGIFAKGEDRTKFRVKTFIGYDEKKILSDLTELMDKSFYREEHCVCAHNGNNFDFPFIARRCVVNQVKIPYILDNSNKKPWEVQCIDTMDMWRFGDYKNFTSLELLASIFGIDTPKDEMDGSQVWKAFYLEKDLDKIKTYCQKDVVTVAQILLKFKGESALEESDIVLTN